MTRLIAARVASRSWHGVSLGGAVGIMIENYLRHERTRYDKLLKSGVTRQEARARVRAKIDQRLQSWKAPRSDPERLSETP